MGSLPRASSGRSCEAARCLHRCSYTQRKCIMKRRRLLSLAPLAVLSLVVPGCSRSPPPPSLTRDVTLAELEQAVRLKNPSTVTIVALANQYLASGRDPD